MGKTNLDTHREAILVNRADQRDGQKSKVYAAENAWRRKLQAESGYRVIESVDEIQEYIDRILQRDYVRRRFFLDERSRYCGPSPITVRGGEGARNATARIDFWTDRRTGLTRHGPCIVLPRWARTEPVILHELAHHLVGLHNEHNWPFVAGMHDLVRNVMGAAAAAELKAQNKKHKVRMFKPPVMPKLTPEQRAAAIANLQKAATCNPNPEGSR